MAKLYWRVKRSGKWTWIPANVVFGDIDYLNEQIHILLDLKDVKVFEIEGEE